MTQNKTSIESWEKTPVNPWPFDKGPRRNFEEVFGRSVGRWLVPTYSQAERDRLLDLELDPRLYPTGQPIDLGDAEPV